MSQRFLFDRADGRGAHALHVRVLLQHHEDLEQRRRRAREQSLRSRPRGSRCAPGSAGFSGRGGAVSVRMASRNSCSSSSLSSDDVHDRAVVALHELLDRQRVRGVLVAEALRELDLVIEQQPVFAPAGEHVQAEAHLPQERLRLLELAQLGRATGIRASAVRRASSRRSGAWPPRRWSGCRAGRPGRSSRSARGCRRCRSP